VVIVALVVVLETRIDFTEDPSMSFYKVTLYSILTASASVVVSFPSASVHFEAMSYN
jgi:hypothetical protein